MATKTKKGSPYASQAALDALVRYGPQTDALKALQQTALDTYDTSVNGARGAAAGTQVAIRSALPVVQHIYDQGTATAAALGGGLSPGANVVEEALNREGAQAKTALVQELVGTKSGQTQATDQARAVLSHALSQIGTEQLSLAGQQGAFTADEVDKLTQSALARKTTRDVAAAHDATSTANNKRTTGTSRRNTDVRSAATVGAGLGKAVGGKKSKSKNLLPGGTPQLPLGQQNTIVNNVLSVAKLIRAEVNKPAPGDVLLPDGSTIKAGQPLTLPAIRALLTTNGNPLGKSFAPVEINSGADLAIRGGLSNPNVSALHASGVKVGKRFPLLRDKKATVAAAITAPVQPDPFSALFKPTLG